MRRTLGRSILTVKVFSVFAGLAFLASVNLVSIADIEAQSAAPTLPADGATVLTVTFADGGIVKFQSKGGAFPHIRIDPLEAVAIQLDVPPRSAARPLVAQALDGGSVAPEHFPAAALQVLTAFRAGSQPGLYRVLLSGTGRSALVRFWVPDPDNPGADPPLITPQSQEVAR